MYNLVLPGPQLVFGIIVFYSDAIIDMLESFGHTKFVNLNTIT